MHLDLDLLLKTYLYIIKKLERNAIREYGPKLDGFLLDLGCGCGVYKKYFSYKKYVGLDVNIELRPSILGNAMALPFCNSVFDSVICTEVLEHLNEPEMCLEELYRVMKSDGVGFITVPMSWNLHYEPNDYFRFTKYGICYLLEKHGFQVIEVKRIGGLFSLIGSRFVDIVSLVIWRKLKKIERIIPYKIRHLIVLCFSIPVSIVFYISSLLLDRINSSDAIGWLVLFRKMDVSQ
ncbi:MAG: hypothetical protein QG641_513 [Candidatus Poribacteria bacterium]|nr:hypothetical protein [Candidatus Poribacteria bacterium]